MKIVQPLAVITLGINPFLEEERQREYERRKTGKGRKGVITLVG